MGFFRPILFADLVALVPVAPALAQQEQNSNAPVYTLPVQPNASVPDARKQGPELNVYRDPATTVTPPPAILPPSTPPPAAQTSKPPAAPPSPATAQTPRPAQSRPDPSQATPAADRPERAKPPAPAPEQPITVAPAPPPAASSPEQTPAPKPVVPPSPAASQPAAYPANSVPWPWIAAALALIAGLGAWLWARRRPARAAPEAGPQAELEPVGDARSEPRSPPRPPSPPPLVEAGTERPWIDIGLDIRAARLSLIGATVGYRLTLRNRGDAPARHVVVRALIANAEAAQESLVQQFLGGEAGLPLHHLDSLAPGETQQLSGEIRLDSADIAPVQIGRRALLVPLIGFDTHYEWASGAGRTARAYVVGQEQEPPTERLAPFRLDLGPKQYRGVASRETALSLSS